MPATAPAMPPGPPVAAAFAPLQLPGPTAVLEAPAPVRALGAVALVGLLGAVLLWRYGPVVERSIDASTSRPLASLVYGAAAHAVIAFGALYLTNQLSTLSAFGGNAGVVGVAVGLVLVVGVAALGFTVVGAAAVSVVAEPSPWLGLLVGAGLAGAAAFVGSLAGGTVWFVLVSMGVGGAARRWLNADEAWTD